MECQRLAVVYYVRREPKLFLSVLRLAPRCNRLHQPVDRSLISCHKSGSSRFQRTAQQVCIQAVQRFNAAVFTYYTAIRWGHDARRLSDELPALTSAGCRWTKFINFHYHRQLAVFNRWHWDDKRTAAAQQQQQLSKPVVSPPSARIGCGVCCVPDPRVRGHVRSTSPDGPSSCFVCVACIDRLVDSARYRLPVDVCGRPPDRHLSRTSRWHAWPDGNR